MFFEFRVCFRVSSTYGYSQVSIIHKKSSSRVSSFKIFKNNLSRVLSFKYSRVSIIHKKSSSRVSNTREYFCPSMHLIKAKLMFIGDL